jgi:hypothetical protein
MRFAWLRDNSGLVDSVKQGFNNPLTRMLFWAFNAAFWIFLLPFFTDVDYGTGFIAFTLIIFTRFGANLYVNQALNGDQYYSFPFRIP